MVNKSAMKIDDDALFNATGYRIGEYIPYYYRDEIRKRIGDNQALIIGVDNERREAVVLMPDRKIVMWPWEFHKGERIG